MTVITPSVWDAAVKKVKGSSTGFKMIMGDDLTKIIKKVCEN